MAWQSSYLATSSLLDVAIADALAALSERDRAQAISVASLLANPERADRASRAKALANELAKIVRALEDGELGLAASAP